MTIRQSTVKPEIDFSFTQVPKYKVFSLVPFFNHRFPSSWIPFMSLNQSWIRAGAVFLLELCPKWVLSSKPDLEFSIADCNGIWDLSKNQTSKVSSNYPSEYYYHFSSIWIYWTFSLFWFAFWWAYSELIKYKNKERWIPWLILFSSSFLKNNGCMEIKDIFGR